MGIIHTLTTSTLSVNIHMHFSLVKHDGVDVEHQEQERREFATEHAASVDRTYSEN